MTHDNRITMSFNTSLSDGEGANPTSWERVEARCPARGSRRHRAAGGIANIAASVAPPGAVITPTRRDR